MPPILLWLDDERPAPNNAYVHVRTAAAAIEQLATGEVIAISLDHDLGPPEAGSGYDVACYIEAHAAAGDLEPFKWTVHSANPVGRARMEMALRNADKKWGEWAEDPLWRPRALSDTEPREVYPCSISRARYGGSCEGGKWVAFPLDPEQVPHDAFVGDDPRAIWFWCGGDYDEESVGTYYVGRGDTPNAALADLIDRLGRRRKPRNAP